MTVAPKRVSRGGGRRRAAQALSAPRVRVAAGSSGEQPRARTESRKGQPRLGYCLPLARCCGSTKTLGGATLCTHGPACCLSCRAAATSRTRLARLVSVGVAVRPSLSRRGGPGRWGAQRHAAPQRVERAMGQRAAQGHRQPRGAPALGGHACAPHAVAPLMRPPP